MSRKHHEVTRTVTRIEFEDPICDWCGITDDDAMETYGFPLTEVVLSINEGEEFGERWTKHVCGNDAEKVFGAFRSIGYMDGLLGDNSEEFTVNPVFGNPLPVIPEPYIMPDKDEDDD